MRFCVGSDEQTPLVDAIVDYLLSVGHEVDRVVAGGEWPEVGRTVGEAIVAGPCDRGIVCCSTGTGVSIAANKVDGIRAALCTDVATTVGARRWNDANVLALSLARTTPSEVAGLLDAFIETNADLDELATIDRLERA